jgi:nicotinate-nucleotide adenylyltransferase
MNRIAFYGGSFDPPHVGHLTIARKLMEVFALDEFVFIPAFHAPHKKDRKPTSAFHRFAMLCLATKGETHLKVSLMEIELPEKPYTIETLTRLKTELTDAELFFVMGADSWAEIKTWREWEKVLSIVNIIVVTRPHYKISFDHVTDEIRARIVDLRKKIKKINFRKQTIRPGIYITDAVQIDVSASEIRQQIAENLPEWRKNVPPEVVKYIEKYKLYFQTSDQNNF